MASTQLIQLPFLYTNNYQLSYLAARTLTLQYGRKRDNSNVADMATADQTTSLTLNINSTGANGLDTGSVAASTFYYVHVIADSKLGNTAKGLISLSRTAPILPTGYDVWAFQGIVKTDASSNFLKFYVAGNGNSREHYWDTILASDVTAGTSQTLANVSLIASVPPIDGLPVMLQVNWTPATANDTVGITPFGSTATTITTVSGSVAAKVNSAQLTVISKLDTATPRVLYINSAASGSTGIYVRGFKYFV